MTHQVCKVKRGVIYTPPTYSVFSAELLFVQMQENVLLFKLDLAAGTEGSIRYIDIARCMSMVNRKLHRQNGMWQVLAAKAFAEATVGVTPTGIPFQVAIRGAPRGWVTRNAIVKGFEAWKGQQSKAYKALGTDGVKPKWQDFKVYLSNAHRAGTEITPTSGDMFGADDAYTITGGEWVHSDIVIEHIDAGNTVVQYQPSLHIIGSDDGITTAGLIQQYQESRPLIQSPDPIIGAGIENNIYAQSSEAIDEQVEGIIENLANDNDNPPYDHTEYPGNDSNASDPQSYAVAANGTGSTLARFVTMNGFSAVNGLLEVQCQLQKAESDAGVFWLQLVIGKRRPY